MQAKPKTVVFISDLHVGSRRGLCPPKVKLQELGAEHKPSKRQQAILKCWQETVSEWRKPDLLVVVGDLVEGQARRSRGVNVWTTDVDLQGQIAANLIEEWEAKKVLIVAGSDYHVVVSGLSAEEWIARDLKRRGINVLPCDPKGSNALTADEVYFSVHGKTFHASHRIESTRFINYRSTAINREIAQNKLASEAEVHRVDCVIRAHLHHFWAIDTGKSYAMIIPGWQAKTKYETQRSPFGMIPQLGAVRFLIWPDGQWRYEKHIYQPVALKPTMLTEVV